MAAPPRRLLAGSSGCKRVAVPLSSVKARTEENEKSAVGVYLAPTLPFTATRASAFRSRWVPPRSSPRNGNSHCFCQKGAPDQPLGNTHTFGPRPPFWLLPPCSNAPRSNLAVVRPAAAAAASSGHRLRLLPPEANYPAGGGDFCTYGVDLQRFPHDFWWSYWVWEGGRHHLFTAMLRHQLRALLVHTTLPKELTLSPLWHCFDFHKGGDHAAWLSLRLQALLTEI